MIEKTSIKVSIIIPTYNSEEFIFETLESVKKQINPNWECIIVDDGSTDNTKTIIKGFLNDQRFSLQPRNRNPKGANTCRNIGAKLAKAKYLLFLDSDDLLDEICIEQRLKFIDYNLDFAVFNITHLQDVDKKIRNRKLKDEKDTHLKMFLRNEIPWSNPSVLWNRNFFLKIGGFDESFQRLQDPDLNTMALLQENVTYSVFNESEVDVYYRLPANPKINEPLFLKKVIQSFIIYIKKYLNMIPHIEHIDESTKQELKDELQLLYFNVILDYFLERRGDKKSLNELLTIAKIFDTINSQKLILLRSILFLNNFSAFKNKAKNIFFAIYILPLKS